MILQQPYDDFGRPEKPSITLCNPNKTQLYSLDMIYNTNLRIRYNGLSEFSFTIPEKIDGKTIEAYAYVVSKRYVLIENIGYFIIESPNETSQGQVYTKQVTCKSIEVELNYKKVVNFSGTMKLYDEFTPTNTLMDRIIKLIPGWTIGTIDTDIASKSRTFKVSDTTVYAFLMNEVENAYDCIFTFDTFNKKINCLSKSNATVDTDIYISFDNLIKNATMKTISDEIVTCLHVYGAGDLDIRTVNPLGTSTIYDFTYFKNTDWISADLLEAINTWEGLVDFYQTTYADKLTQLKTQNEKLLDLKNNTTNGLVTLQAEYDALVGVQKVRIEAGLAYADITAQMTAKQAAIDAKKVEISNVEATIKTIQEALAAINSALKFENNFTADQIIELNSFIIENTYQNSNFLQTDIMSPAEIQDVAQDLYNQAKGYTDADGVFHDGVLTRVAVPRYEFEMELVNFLWLKDYSRFSSELDLGCVVTIDLDKYTVESVLLEIEMSYDDPNVFKLVFSNRLRLDNEGFIFSDLFGEVVETGAKVNFDSEKWSNFQDNYKDEVSQFINGALDASKNNVINAENQEITINKNGLKGRKSTGNNTYSGEQVWLTSNTLAFTKNNWQTASAALGKLPNGSFGLVGETIVGKILAGNNLTIESEKKDGTTAVFKIDGSGAYLHNSQLDIVNTNSRILLNPTDGLTIQAKENGVWKSRFYADSSGNLVLTGKLTGATGEFSGTITASAGKIGSWTLDAKGMTGGSDGDHIYPNDIKLGELTILNGKATFNGTFSADKIIGQIVDSQIRDVSAGKIGTGTMLGDRIAGGTIAGTGGATIGLTGSGVINIGGNAQVSGELTVTRSSYFGNLNLTVGNNLHIQGGNLTVGGSITGNSITINSAESLNINSGTLVSVPIYVGGGFPAQRLRFVHGLLVSYSNA